MTFEGSLKKSGKFGFLQYNYTLGDRFFCSFGIPCRDYFVNEAFWLVNESLNANQNNANQPLAQQEENGKVLQQPVVYLFSIVDKTMLNEVNSRFHSKA